MKDGEGLMRVPVMLAWMHCADADGEGVGGGLIAEAIRRLLIWMKSGSSSIFFRVIINRMASLKDVTLQYLGLYPTGFVTKGASVWLE